MSDQTGIPGSRSRDEKLMAAVAHGLVVATGVGAIGAAAIWILNREKNQYAAFQAAQAVIFQVLGVLLTVGCWVCWSVGYFASLVPLMAAPNAYPEPPWFFWAGLLSMVIPFAFMGLLWLYGLWGAVRSLQGKPFRYLLLGPWVEHFLSERD